MILAQYWKASRQKQLQSNNKPELEITDQPSINHDNDKFSQQKRPWWESNFMYCIEAFSIQMLMSLILALMVATKLLPSISNHSLELHDTEGSISSYMQSFLKTAK